jgi:fluoride exporter
LEAFFEFVTSKLLQLARNNVVMLILGGSAGTLLRHLLGKWFGEQSWTRGFPYGTMVINVTGSLILGFAAVVIRERLPVRHQDLYLLIGTGFCGGYTTFSTFEWETFQLVNDGSYARALYNVIGSVILGFAAVVLGVALAHLLFPRRP